MNTGNQMLLLVDESDIFSGEYAKRIDCHLGKGLHHRAFVVLLENSKGEVLLQKRKHTLWDDFWDTTAISHVLHLEDHDETYEDAGLRALKDEMGIINVKILKVGGFNYFAKHERNSENEYCAILLGKYDGEIFPSSEALYEFKWLDKKNFIKDCLTSDPKYTPWALLTGKYLYEQEK